MSILVNINDSPRAIAYCIYYQAEVNESVDIFGWSTSEISQRVCPTGDLVVEELRHWDEVENIADNGKKRYRKYNYISGAIGGPIAQKVFKFKKVVLDNCPRVTIWRIQ